MRFVHLKESERPSGWWLEAWIVEGSYGFGNFCSYISEEDCLRKNPGKKIRHIVENPVGGHTDYDESNIDNEKFAGSWDSFYRGIYTSGNEMSPLIKNDSKYGWISPTGEFFGCTVADHRLVAEKVFNTTEVGLENKGYVKVSRRDYDLKDGILAIKGINEYQRQTLHRLGWEDDKIDEELFSF